VTAPATSPLSYNLYVQQLGVMAVADTSETAGVWAFDDAPLQTALPQALNYAELRIQRDIDFLQARSSNLYTLAAGVPVFTIPINDFLIVETIEIAQLNGAQVVNGFPLTPVSREFIQNCYGSLAQSGRPKFFAMYGDTFGDGANSGINILFGPPPNFAWPLRVNGVIRLPSLAQYDTEGPADTSYTYISEFLPDLLMMASMIYISAFQRNFSANSDSPDMGQSYEKQYQALRLGAISEENRKKFQGSAWSSYSTPTAATPTR
jgi:hypothetical protein